MPGFISALSYIADSIVALLKLVIVVPMFLVLLFSGGVMSISNKESFASQAKQLQASLPAPYMVAAYSCLGVNGDLEWQLWSVSAVDPGNPNPEVGIPPSIYASPELKGVFNGQVFFDTGATRSITIPNRVATTSIPITQSTKVALTDIANLLVSTSSSAQAGIKIMRDCLIEHASDIAPLVQFRDWGDHITQEFRTAAPAGRAVGTKDNFPKIIPIPGLGTHSPVWVTVLPGQSAAGTIDGHRVELTVDAQTAPDILPQGHILVDGQETTGDNLGEVYIGKVMVTPATQYGDGSVLWDIFY